MKNREINSAKLTLFCIDLDNEILGFETTVIDCFKPYLSNLRFIFNIENEYCESGKKMWCSQRVYSWTTLIFGSH